MLEKLADNLDLVIYNFENLPNPTWIAAFSALKDKFKTKINYCFKNETLQQTINLDEGDITIESSDAAMPAQYQAHFNNCIHQLQEKTDINFVYSSSAPDIEICWATFTHPSSMANRLLGITLTSLAGTGFGVDVHIKIIINNDIKGEWYNSAISDFFQTCMTITHELGHAILLEHPFDNEDGDAETGILPISQTVMSYTYDAVPVNQTSAGALFTTNDISALQNIWGLPPVNVSQLEAAIGELQEENDELQVTILQFQQQHNLPIADICFPAGTPVTTDQGPIAIEKLIPGTHTIKEKPIVGISQTKSSDDYLLCFEKHALGHNIPDQQTIVSREHCILYKGKMKRACTFMRYARIRKIKYTGDTLYNVVLEKCGSMTVNNMTVETLHPKHWVAQKNFCSTFFKS